MKLSVDEHSDEISGKTMADDVVAGCNDLKEQTAFGAVVARQSDGSSSVRR